MNECFMGRSPVEGSDEKFYVSVLPEVTIYGHTIDAWTQEHYPEDWEMVQEARTRGFEWGCWHSPMCPDGEIGSTAVAVIEPLTYEQFIEAREKGWPHGDYALTEATRDRPASTIYTFGPDGLVEVWNSLTGEGT